MKTSGARHPANLNDEISTRLVLDQVAEPPKFAGELVVIDVLNELLCREHLVILQSLPTSLRRVMRRVEEDAVAVQMRIERA